MTINEETLNERLHYMDNQIQNLTESFKNISHQNYILSFALHAVITTYPVDGNQVLRAFAKKKNQFPEADYQNLKNLLEKILPPSSLPEKEATQQSEAPNWDYYVIQGGKPPAESE